MVYLQRYSFLFILIFNSFLLHAQLEFSGSPKLNSEQLSQLKAEIIIPEKKVLQNTQRDPINEFSFKDDVFAEPIKVNFTPDRFGNWFEMPDGKKIWAIYVKTEGKSVNIIFSKYSIVKGVKIFIYDMAKNEVFGAYTFRNNKRSGKLATTPVNSSHVVVEMQVARGIENYGKLEIGQIGVGFKTLILKGTDDQWYGTSADCHVDIKCMSNMNYQRQKYSVCRIIYNGSSRCTGILLNNTNYDGIPYVITARHCIKYDSQAENAIFYFDYESPSCDGPDGELHSISGSEIKATVSGLDYTLLELSEKPPLNYLPLYSGWNATGEIPQSSYIIHHPQGDVKKISVNDDPLSTGNLDNVHDVNTHWLVEDYEEGSTENGSSGGPAFDQDNRLIGTLSGGLPVCTPVINDLYQKFSHCWADYSEADQQLKHWLDPDSTGILSIGNYDPSRVYAETAEVISNIDSIDKIIDGSELLEWGYISGHNNRLTNKYAEHFYRNGSKYIYGVLLEPSRIYYNEAIANLDLVIWEGATIPREELYRQSVDYIELEEDEEVFIQLDSVILVDYDFFIGYQIYYDAPIDTFALHIAQPFEDRENTAYTYTDNGWSKLAGTNITYNTSLAISALTFDYKPDFKASDFVRDLPDITIYPNPTTDQVQIYVKDLYSSYILIRLLDATGRLLKTIKITDPEPNIPLSVEDLPTGLYILELVSETFHYSEKVLKVK